MRAVAQIIDGGLSSRSESKHERLDYRSFSAALLVFAAYYLGAKIGFALTQRLSSRLNNHDAISLRCWHR